MLRVGMLTSGGDCQALNATMRGVVKALSSNVQDLEVYGFINGYKGLIYGDYRLLTVRKLSDDETVRFFGRSHKRRNDARHIQTAV